MASTSSMLPPVILNPAMLCDETSLIGRKMRCAMVV